MKSFMESVRITHKTGFLFHTGTDLFYFDEICSADSVLYNICYCL